MLRMPALCLGIAILLSGGAAAGQERFKDCDTCPEMVVIPAGSFVMGAPDDEPNRQAWDGPQVNVTINRPFALARYEITRGQFRQFMTETRHRIEPFCRVFTGSWNTSQEHDWTQTNYAQTDDHPVVCVDWYDALAYINWLNTKGGHTYYLPSEAEFEYALRGGTTTTHFWGDSKAPICRHANVAGQEFLARFPEVDAHRCNDGSVFTQPVGSYPPNPFGLYDIVGNVWEWVFDCWSFDHSTAHEDGRPVTEGEHCERRIIKGAGYESVAKYTRSAARGRDKIPGTHIAVIGFRVAARLE